MNKHVSYSDMSDVERLERLGAFQIDTPQFLEAKSALLRLYRGWRTTRDGHLITLTGNSGVGKTTVADDLIQELEEEWQSVVKDNNNEVQEPQHPQPKTLGITKEVSTGIIRPVVKVFVEPRARARGLLRDILYALGVRSNVHETFGELMERVQVHMVGQQVRLLLLDEVHHVVERHGSKTAYEAVEIIKMLLLQARVQIACVGLPITETIFEKNPELPRHSRGRLRMVPFTDDLTARSDYMRFLKALERGLPFDTSNNLTDKDTAMRLHLATGGFIGNIFNLVHAASETAIGLNLPGITQKLLCEVFERVSGVPRSENPFSAVTFDQNTITWLRNRLDARREGLEAYRGDVPKPSSRTTTDPDFTKR